MKSVEAFPTFENPVVPRFNRIYRTGDFGVLVNGLIYYEGRQDSQVKVRGQRVNLAEVEKVMVQTLRDYLRTVCVLVVKPRQQNQKIVAFFNLKSPICNQKINTILQNVLPAFMMPTLYQVKDFPTLVNGKIDRQALLKMYNDSLIQTFEYSDDDLKDVEAKFRPKARVILNAIGTTIGITDVDSKPKLSDNFYQIGGTSINAMTAANKINAHDLFRDGQIGVVEFFSAKTILDLVVKNSDSAVDDEVVIRPMRESDRDVVTLNNAKGLANQEMLTSAVQPTLDETIKFVDVTWIAFRQMNFKYCLVAEKNGEGSWSVFCPGSSLRCLGQSNNGKH